MPIAHEVALIEPLPRWKPVPAMPVQRSKIDMLSDAAHEIRSPLARLQGYGELLEHGRIPSGEIQAIGERIRRQASRLASTVDDILELARIEAHGGRNFRLRPTNAQALILEVLDGMPVDESERISLVHTAEPLLPVMVDPSRMGRALINLFENACKYSPPGRPITVRISLRRPSPTAPWVAIHVRDHGMGISQEDASRAFGRFYRSEAVSSVPGSGLGLAIAEQIVRLHDGRIQLRGRCGSGTIASLMLPAAVTAQTA